MFVQSKVFLVSRSDCHIQCLIFSTVNVSDIKAMCSCVCVSILFGLCAELLIYINFDDASGKVLSAKKPEEPNSVT